MLARWFASIGMHADPALLLLTNGARHALSLAFSVACGNGGTLLTEAQTYPGALVLARHHGLDVVGVAVDGEGILPDALDQSLRSLHGARTALYTTPTMHNPTTATMSRTRREAIQQECGQRMDCAMSLLAGRVRTPNYPGHRLWMPMPLKEAEALRDAAAAFGILLTPPTTTAATSDPQESGVRICIGAVPLSDLTSALTTMARLQHGSSDRCGNRSPLF